MTLSGETRMHEEMLRDGVAIPGHWLETLIQKNCDLPELGLDVPIQESTGAVKIQRRGITGKYSQEEVREILLRHGRLPGGEETC